MSIFTIQNPDFETAGSAPTLYGSTVIQSNDFETATATVDYFHSIGTEALGTLAAWTTISGTPSISSNLVTLKPGDGIAGGHTDWGDGTWLNRFQWNTGGSITSAIHHVNSNNYVYARYEGTGLTLYKLVGGASTQVATSAYAGTTGTYYWLQVQASGTTYTLTLFADSSGAKGSQLATCSGTISDSGIQSGNWYLYCASGATGNILVGGAYANVCYVTGPAPTGWSTHPAVNSWSSAAEPAFCWSAAQAYYGTHSLSVYLATSGQSIGSWLGPASVLANGSSNAINCWIQTATGLLGRQESTTGGHWASANVGSASGPVAWSPATASYTGIGAGEALQLQAQKTTVSAVGAVYFDYATIVQPTTPTGVLFRSLGTDATGTLNSWTTQGSPAISGNVVALTNGAGGVAGHSDWADVTLVARVQPTSAASECRAWVRTDGNFSQGLNGYMTFLQPGVSTLHVWSRVGGGGVTSLASTSIQQVVQGSWYWLVLQASGTTITATAYKDAGGYIGDQLGTVSATDSAFATGRVAVIEQGGAGQTSNFGGAYADVLLVQGTLPANWTPVVSGGEPAFCWSAVNPESGTHAASIFNGSSAGNGSWQQAGSLAGTGTFQIQGYLRSSGPATNMVLSGTLAAASPNVAEDNAYHQVPLVAVSTATGPETLSLPAAGAGTAYWDNLDEGDQFYASIALVITARSGVI